MHSDGRPLKEHIMQLIHSITATRITVDELCIRLGQDGLLVLCAILTLPFMVPVSIPGVSTVFGMLIIVLGFAIALDIPPCLPKKLKEKSFETAALKAAFTKGLVWIGRIEKISRPRLEYFVSGTAAYRLHSIALIIAAVLLVAPFGFIPFSNTLPGLAILLFALGLLQKDGYCVILGYITVLVTIVYFVFLLTGGIAVLEKVIAAVQAFFTT